MKKFLLITALSALLAVGFLACNGMSPLSQGGDGTFHEPPCDYSGTYEITFHEHYCYDDAYTHMTIVQTGTDLFISVGREGIDEDVVTYTGTVDCDTGEFSATGYTEDDGGCDISISGNLETMTGIAGCSGDPNNGYWDQNHNEDDDEWHFCSCDPEGQ